MGNNSMFQIDRIEIVKGAGSALYGSSALGGVINVITKEIGETPEVRFRLFSGIYDRPAYAEWDWSDKTRLNTGGFISYSNRIGQFDIFSVSLEWWTIAIAKTMCTIGGAYTQNSIIIFHSIKVQHLLPISSGADMAIFFWWKSLSDVTRPVIHNWG